MRVAGVSSLLRGAFVALAIGLLLAGCASTPKPGSEATRVPAARPPPSPDRDGPGANPPPDLASLPDAEPRVEPIRPGGANKPYQALGRDYLPITRDVAFSERGLASWYGRKFHGRRTASGEPYDMYVMTAAHPTLPIPSYARIRNPANGREVIVRVNDRGPFHPGRIVDLSYAAALRLDLLRGVAPVELERITFDEIRAGSWRRGDAATRLAATSPRPKSEAANSPGRSADPGPAVVLAGEGGEAAPLATPSPSGTIAASVESAPIAVAPLAAAPPVAAGSLAPAPAAPPPARGFWVQLGAFRESAGAESFQRRVAVEFDWIAPLLATFGDAALFRVQAGPYASRDEAQSVAGRIREALGLVPLVVERH
ncbi:MAG: septal ring lytic transglycosylase RlpA family protein [Caldimonas sp.]